MTSNINPNNIDGAYPVAGQDNNSQGFRDNFTNTKTNFAYAAAEISDLQNKAVLKSALTGGTLNNNMLGSILSNAQLQQMSNTVVPLGSISGIVGVNYTSGSYQTVTTAGPISLEFTNFTAAGTQDQVLVQVTVTDVAHTMQLPSSVGYGASATSELGIQGLNIGTNTITFPATGTYVYSFITADAGTSVYINDLTQGRVGFSGNISVAGNLSVTGTITGNIEIDNIESIVGNVTAGNVLTGGVVSATGNVRGGNINTAGAVSATGNVYAGNVINLGVSSVTGNVVSGNVLTSGLISATGNATAGNILTAGIVSSTGNAVHGNVLTAGQVSATGNVTSGNIISSGAVTGNISVIVPVRANITATNTYSLSTTNSINLLVANNTGYTATLNMPTSPVNGQICNFAIHGNSVTLAVGTGNVLPTFAGLTAVGTGYRYVYYATDAAWYRVG